MSYQFGRLAAVYFKITILDLKNAIKSDAVLVNFLLSLCFSAFKCCKIEGFQILHKKFSARLLILKNVQFNICVLIQMTLIYNVYS